MTNTEIATLISERIGPRPVPFESVRALALEIYQDLGGTEGDEDFEDIYAILLATIPLAQCGGGAVIDDNNVSTNTTWSSSKIVSELDANLADYATIANVDASLAEKADKSELGNYATWNVVNTSLNLKQDTLIPGENITILNNVISATGGSSGASIDDNNVSTNTTWSSSKITSELSDYAKDASLADYAKIEDLSNYATNASLAEKADKSELGDYATWDVIDTSLGLKQDTLTAGENITIQNNVISAAGTDLSDYYTKSEVDTALAGKADNSDLDEYATWSVVETSLGLKANTSDVNDALDLKADKSELNDYAKLDDISTFVTKNDASVYALDASLADYAKKTDVDASLADYATLDDISTFVTLNDASIYATRTSVNNKANKNDINIPYNNGYDWSVLNNKADGIYRVSVILNSTIILQKGWLIAIKYVVGTITEYRQTLLLTLAQNLTGTIGFEIWKRESSDGTTWTNSLRIIPKIDDFSVGILQTYSSDKIEKLIAALDASIADCATKNDVSVYAEKTYVDSSLALKQDTLTAGTNITIQNNVISAASTDLSNYYTKSEVDTALSGKVDDSDLNNYYNKTEIDTVLAGKADDSDLDAYATIANVNTSLGNYYTKSEVDTALSGKVDNADLDDYYTKTQIDTSINNALALKADKTYVDSSLALKQNVLTAGTNININNNVISAEGYIFNTTDGTFKTKYKQDVEDGGQIVSNTASGLGAVAEGYNTTASGDYGSHADGTLTLASGQASHASGIGTIASNMGEFAVGSYNLSHYDTNYDAPDPSDIVGPGATVFSVGAGGYDNGQLNRLNAFEVMYDGSTYLYDVGNYAGGDTHIQNASVQTVQTVINSKATLVILTQAQYDALQTKDARTLYIISDVQ